MNALGFVEITGIVRATTALDDMCKAADVRFVGWQKKLGGRLVTIIIEGKVSAVKEAVAAVKEAVVTGVLANPHPEVIRLIKRSNKNAESKEEGGNQDGSIGNDRNQGSDSGN